MPPNCTSNISNNAINNKNSKPNPKAGAGFAVDFVVPVHGVAVDVDGAVGRHVELLGDRYLAELPTLNTIL